MGGESSRSLKGTEGGRRDWSSQSELVKSVACRWQEGQCRWMHGRSQAGISGGKESISADRPKTKRGQLRGCGEGTTEKTERKKKRREKKEERKNTHTGSKLKGGGTTSPHKTRTNQMNRFHSQA